jgi:hypothetical protein
MRLPSSEAFALSLFGLLITGGCSSKVTETVDLDRQAKLETVQDCLPGQLQRLLGLIEFAGLWRLNQGSFPVDPPGLTWNQQAGGELSYTLSFTSFTLSGIITFYSPSGVAQNLILPTSSLSAAIDEAATQLRANFASGSPFLVGSWTMTGSGVTGGGNFTGIIGGSSSGNELLELRTTRSTPAGGGPPVLQPGSITISGTRTCTLDFLIPGISTDGDPGQEYPRGRIEFDLEGPAASVAATMTLDGGPVARVVVEGLRGFLTVNLDTLQIGAGR